MTPYVENLLAPVSVGSNPVGADLSDSNEMFRIDELKVGKPEREEVKDGQTVLMPPEPPVWKTLQKECEAFLGKCKHLKVAAILTTCLLRQRRLEGFRDGLELVLGLCRNYWTELYPPLDPPATPGDKPDATYRLNLLASLRAPRWPTEWLLVLNHLYETPIAGADGQVVTLLAMDVARGREKLPEGTPKGPDESSLNAMIRSTPLPELQATHALLVELVGLVNELDGFLTEQAGSGNAEGFAPLVETLERMEGILAPYLPGSEGEPAPDEAVSDPDGDGAESAAPDGGTGARAEGGTGVIRSRDDVIKQLDVICAFMERTEPSSPVNFILRRAQRMVGMDFLQLVSELALTATDPREALKPAMGIGLPTPPEEPPAAG